MADKTLRCAVYTRKSTDYGLEQEFNSLDAQYEACAAYAVSQRHEGWLLNPERYDDGGFSGGNMERPGLKQLMAEVAAGNVDIILLYKIDRLTRSLADFAKIVEVLDKAGASFVSITQSFNTTTSMGRLTLNMLLSFAQFEREVTGERIRDKIAASKRKGIWMGGPVPLGYDVRERKLVANEAEAELVRHIMRCYLELGSAEELLDHLHREGHRTKVQKRTSGPNKGGVPFTRSMVYYLLANRIYRGLLVHKGEAWPGEHEAIVSQEVWDEVQAKLKAGANGTTRRLRAQHPALLVGKLYDGEGRPMTSSHAKNHNRRYRYYNTRPETLDGAPAWRVSAYDLETLVCSRVAAFLKARGDLHDEIGHKLNPLDLPSLFANANSLADELLGPDARCKAAQLGRIIDRVELKSDSVQITIAPATLIESLGHVSRDSSGELVALSCEATRVRRGMQMRLIIPGAEAPRPATRDHKLIQLLVEAQRTRELLLSSPGKSIRMLASEQGRCRTRFTKLLSVAGLAPEIVSSVLQGRQPRSLTCERLMSGFVPCDWADQRKQLGLSSL